MLFTKAIPGVTPLLNRLATAKFEIAEIAAKNFVARALFNSAVVQPNLSQKTGANIARCRYYDDFPCKLCTNERPVVMVRCLLVLSLLRLRVWLESWWWMDGMVAIGGGVVVTLLSRSRNVYYESNAKSGGGGVWRPRWWQTKARVVEVGEWGIQQAAYLYERCIVVAVRGLRCDSTYVMSFAK